MKTRYQAIQLGHKEIKINKMCLKTRTLNKWKAKDSFERNRRKTPKQRFFQQRLDKMKSQQRDLEQSKLLKRV
jgi:hypothetical protein